MKNNLGVKSFITWHPPKKSVTVGGIKVSAGNGVVINTKTATSSSQSFWPTVSLEYENIAQGELSLWVLFHAFIIGDPWTIPSYMHTIQGVVEFMGGPLGSEKDYDDFLNVAYQAEGINQKMSYSDLYNRFILLSERQSGMVKNFLLDMKPGPQWSHAEMTDYSYWRMVIDYSIVEAIIGKQSFCDEEHKCLICKKTQLQHYPTTARKWLESRLMEIIDDVKKVEQYMKIIWTVRQYIRHDTVHESAYPHKRPTGKLQSGDNKFDVDRIVSNFKKDSHALTALEDGMHEVTRILLMDDILHTKIFPDIRPYMIRFGGGMSWEEFNKLVN